MDLEELWGEDVTSFIDCDGNTLLHLSAHHGRGIETDYLIQNGCYVNAINRFGFTPLCYAVMSSNDEAVSVVQILLDSGANVFIRNCDGQGPLHLFMANPSQTVGKLLLNAIRSSGLDEESIASVLINAGWPLPYIIWMGSESLTSIVINRGADVNCQDSDGFTALHDAVAELELKQIALLLECGADIHSKTLHGYTSLHIAMQHNSNDSHFQVMELLLQNGADVNARTNDGRTSIHFALKSGTMRMIETLLDYGADLGLKDLKNKTALHFAAYNSDANVMSLVLSSGKVADVNGKNSRGQTALHMASKMCSESIAKELLDRGANVNEKDDFDRTPLYLAVNAHVNCFCSRVSRCHKLVRRLLQYKPDLNQRTRRDEMVLESAVKLRDNDIAKIIVEEIAVRRIQKSGVDAKNYSVIQGNIELDDYYNKCCEELERMRKLKIYDLVSVLNILVDGQKAIAGYMRNENLIDNYGQIDRMANFIIYHDMLERRFFEELKIQRLRKSASLILRRIIGFVDPTHIVIETILDHFSQDDMYNLLLEFGSL